MDIHGQAFRGFSSLQVPTVISLACDAAACLFPVLLLSAAAAKLLQSCSSLCNPIDGSPPGSPIHGFLQARTLKWVAISFSNAWKWNGKVKSLSHVRPSATPWTAAHQAPSSMGVLTRVLEWVAIAFSGIAFLKTQLCFTSQICISIAFYLFSIVIAAFYSTTDLQSIVYSISLPLTYCFL